MTVVVDSSVALSWCFEDERTPETRAVLGAVGEAGALAPQHWPLEVLNGLMVAERRKRIDAARRRGFASFLRDLPIVLDQETAIHAWGAAQSLAERFRLTLYDAAYLELARRMASPLASLDRDLRKAAAALGVRLLGVAEA